MMMIKIIKLKSILLVWLNVISVPINSNFKKYSLLDRQFLRICLLRVPVWPSFSRSNKNKISLLAPSLGTWYCLFCTNDSALDFIPVYFNVVCLCCDRWC